MKGKVEAGMEFRYWSENVNISYSAASGLPAPAKSLLRAGLPVAGIFHGLFGNRGRQEWKEFFKDDSSLDSPTWGSDLCSQFPFSSLDQTPSWKLSLSWAESICLPAGGRCSKAMEWEYGKDAEKTVTFAHWGFLFAYKEFVLSESWSCYLFSDALQKVLPKSLQCGLLQGGFNPWHSSSH